MIILGWFVVVTAGVLMVALAHIVGHIAMAVVSIHIAYETFLLAAMRAGELLLTTSRQLAGL